MVSCPRRTSASSIEETQLKYCSAACFVEVGFIVSRGQGFAVLAFVAVAYALLVPIVPFQTFYIVDSNDSSRAHNLVWIILGPPA